MNQLWKIVAAGVAVVATGLLIGQWYNFTSSSTTSDITPVDTPPAAQATLASANALVSAETRATIQAAVYPEFSPVNAKAVSSEPVVQLCQACLPCGPRSLCGVQCGDGCYCDGHEPNWKNREMLPFDIYSQGEYVGPARAPHVPIYRIRVDDLLGFTFILSRRYLNGQYKLEVGDRVTIESITDEALNRDHLISGASSTNDDGQGILVQPDGNITLPLLGQVKAANRTIADLTADLEERYKKFYKVPGITVTPLKVNTRLYDFRDSIDQRFGAGGLGTQARVTPEGTVQLPGIGSVPVHGLSISELQAEVNARYAEKYQGLDVTVSLVDRAPRFVYVLGEVATPGVFELTGPTSVMQSVALAGGWNNGGNIRHIVIFRRDENWCLMATRLDLRGAMLGKRPCPADEIWVRDGDIVLVPKSGLLLADDFIELVFTRGIYGVLPFSTSVSFDKLTTI